MNRRQLLQLATAGGTHALISRKSNAPKASIRRRMACAVRSDQMHLYFSRLSTLRAIEIDWLDPTFPERASAAIPVVQQALASYRGRILLSGPFIDLHPGSSEKLIQQATRERFDECYKFALAIGAREIIFLSSYRPIINLSFYDEGWLTQSIAFWGSYLDAVDPRVTVLLCNTFEYHPKLMLKVVQEVARPNFLSAISLFTTVPLSQWLRTTASHTSSVYVHSNDGKVDSHEELGRGVLTYSQMNEVAAAIGPDANLILKMNDKESLERSLKWLESCFTQGGHTR